MSTRPRRTAKTGSRQTRLRPPRGFPPTRLAAARSGDGRGQVGARRSGDARRDLPLQQVQRQGDGRSERSGLQRRTESLFRRIRGGALRVGAHPQKSAGARRRPPDRAQHRRRVRFMVAHGSQPLPDAGTGCRTERLCDLHDRRQADAVDLPQHRGRRPSSSAHTT